MQAVILAAGRGTRLHPITLNRTKAMCPIVGKPIVERVMDTMIANGIRQFVLVVSPDDPEIQPYFENQSHIEARVQFVLQPERLGMGHALLQAAAYVHGDFILSSCDNLVSNDEIAEMIKTWKAEQPNGLLTTLRVGPDKITRMGIVELDGHWITHIVEKPSLEEAPSDLASPPLYIFSNRLLDYLPEIPLSPRGEYELQDAIQMLIEKEGCVRSHRLGNRVDLTTPADLLAINLQYLPSDQDVITIKNGVIGTNTQFRNPVIIDENVTIGENCVIGPNVYLETGCTIEDEVRLENVIVLRDRIVISGSMFWDEVVF